MDRPVEVVVLNRGNVENVHVLSPRRERLAGLLGALGGAAAVGTGMTFVAGWLGAVDRVVHGPTFLAVWAVVATAVAWSCAGFAAARARRYRVGADIDADAFAPGDIELVRRVGADYELGLLPGMTGVLAGGRASLPVEALTAHGPVRVPLPEEGSVRVELGATAFVISRKADAIAVPALMRRVLSAGRASATYLTRVASVGVSMAALVSAAMTVPQSGALAEADSPALVRVDNVPRIRVRLLPVSESADYQLAPGAPFCAAERQLLPSDSDRAPGGPAARHVVVRDVDPTGAGVSVVAGLK